MLKITPVGVRKSSRGRAFPSDTPGQTKPNKTPPLQHPNDQPPPAGEVGEPANREGVARIRAATPAIGLATLDEQPSACHRSYASDRTEQPPQTVQRLVINALALAMIVSANRSSVAAQSISVDKTIIIQRRPPSFASPPEITQLISVMADQNASPVDRQAAYIKLALTGGRRGRSAVLIFRDRSRILPSLEERMGLAQLPRAAVGLTKGSFDRELIDTYQSPDGTLYGLYRCDVIGTPDDLWLIQWEDNKWSHPLFTGQVLKHPAGLKTIYQDKFQYSTREELLKGKAWARRYIGNPSIERDSDRDGLNDLAELRLGTNPRDPDTDHDGIPDSIDGNPFAAPRKLSEDEEIETAAFEAYELFYHPSAPTVLTSGSKRPFELPGAENYVISADHALGLVEQFGYGPLEIGWGQVKKFGNEAELEVSGATGLLGGTGYRVRLTKVEGHWFVVQMRVDVVG